MMESPSSSPLSHGDPGGYEVALDVFEGPLDLLLHLVRKHELDILDIPIAFVCEKYLEYLAFMQSLDIEVAGEYLVMAATLAWLKSRELLPRQDAGDEGEDRRDEEDPREKLIAQLLEYRTFREAADRMGGMPLEGRDIFPRGAHVDLPPLDPGLAPVTLFRLADAFHRVLDRARVRKSHEVVLERITVRERMRQLTLALSEEPRLAFESLFLGRTWNSEQELRSMLVVTLMSILEMVRLGLLKVHQPQDADALWIERALDPEAMAEAVEAATASLDEGGEPSGLQAPPPAVDRPAPTRPDEDHGPT